MRLLFVGLGSIAKRHIHNLLEIWPNIKIDILRHQIRAIENDSDTGICGIYYDISELDHKYDAIFITNPTSEHYNALKLLWPYSDHFFIEKPVFMTGEEDIKEFGLDDSKVCYVACPLRYTNVMSFFKENISVGNVLSVRSIVSSYLPDWRPNIDYRKTYSAHKELGGGVSIDLVHEWDYLCYLFGKPIYVNSLIKRKSDLEIDSDDIAIYIAEYQQYMVELHLDYFGRVPIRKMQVICKDDTVEADLINGQIFFRRTGNRIDLKEDRNDYQKRELVHFFDIVNGKCENDSTIENACYVLRLARGIV